MGLLREEEESSHLRAGENTVHRVGTAQPNLGAVWSTDAKGRVTERHHF